MALKDDYLQVYSNKSLLCQKQIPTPAKISVGSTFYEIIGNPYISQDGSLVLIQSYTDSDGKPTLDYAILAKNCNKIIPTCSSFGNYLVQNNEGKYGLLFRDGYKYEGLDFPYGGFSFYTVDGNYLKPPKPTPTTIYLDESTVESVRFTFWGSTEYNHRYINAVSVRLNIKSYGELDLSYIYDLYESIEIDDAFDDLFDDEFPPQEYNSQFLRLIQIINTYYNKN